MTQDSTLDTTTEPINPVAGRRTVEVRIGNGTYTARAPKLKVWLDAAQILESQQAQREAGNRADRRAGGDAAGEGLTRSQLTLVLGAFLRGCLTKEAAAAVDAELDDPETDLDVPDLWAVSMSLIREYQPDMLERAKAMGLKVPASVAALTAEATTPAAPARRTPQDRKAPAKKPPRKATSGSR